MKKDETRLGAMAAIVVALILITGALFPACGAPRVAAQVPDLSPALALARTAVREAGLRAFERDDTAAIHAVVSFRAEHIYRSGYLESIYRATRGAFLRRSAPRPWIVGLEASGRRPALWPGHLRWSGRGDRDWRDTFEHSRDVLTGAIEHRCTDPDGNPATPHDWGSEHDAIRFEWRNPTAIELDCGQTCTLDASGRPRLTRDGLERCNHFYAIPRYVRRFEGL